MCVIFFFVTAIDTFELLQRTGNQGSHGSGSYADGLSHLVVAESFLSHQQQTLIPLGELVKGGTNARDSIVAFRFDIGSRERRRQDRAGNQQLLSPCHSPAM